MIDKQISALVRNGWSHCIDVAEFDQSQSSSIAISLTELSACFACCSCLGGKNENIPQEDQ